jgi:hypothetical protein
MRRRSVIAAAATCAVAGCISPSDGSDRDLQPSNDTDTPHEGPDPEDVSERFDGVGDGDPSGSHESPDSRGRERNAVLNARWVEYNPEDSGADPYPTDQPPIAEYDVLLELFDRAADADEWEPPGTRTRTAEPRLGDTVVETVSIERGEEIVDDIRGLENESETQPPGRYFDHEGTLTAFHMYFED